MATEKAQIIKDKSGTPIFAVIDYQEYLRLLDEAIDAEGIKHDIEEAEKRINDKTRPFEKVVKEIENKYHNK